MVERQPGRPTVQEFTGAALRLIEDDYPVKYIHVSCGPFVNVEGKQLGRAADIDILRREIIADGIPGTRESILDFAIKQLAWYQKSKKS